VEEALKKLLSTDYHVLLTEADLPDGDWLDVLHLTRELPGELKVIVTDVHADARFWSQVLNLGAYDVLARPFYEPEVRRILHNGCGFVAEPRYATAV